MPFSMKMYLQKDTWRFITDIINPMGPVSICESSWERTSVTLSFFAGLVKPTSIWGKIANALGCVGLGKILVKWNTCRFFLLLQSALPHFHFLLLSASPLHKSKQTEALMPTGLKGIHVSSVHHSSVSAREHAIQLLSTDFAEMKNPPIAGAHGICYFPPAQYI